MDRDEPYWTAEQANAALPRVRETVRRIQELVGERREQADRAAVRVEGNGQAPGKTATSELQRAVEELSRDGIVLRDVDSGLVDFPARSPSGRQYLLCWLVHEPQVAWWHWPDAGFAGRRPLSDPPE
jgi:hypothetical protein